MIARGSGLAKTHLLRIRRRHANGGLLMGINDESNIEANLQIGPTDQGMVRLFIEGQIFS